MISIVANFSEKLPVLFFFLLLSVATANLRYLLETTFSSLRFLFNFTSLQSFESGQRGFLFSFSGVKVGSRYDERLSFRSFRSLS